MILVGVVGVNHKSCDLNLREKLANACMRFNQVHIGHSFVVLSTCNRTEVYFTSQDLTCTHSYILKTLRYAINEEFEHKLYSYFGSDCFLHLAKVTAGLDSAIFAETEIQGQVKRAYEQARQKAQMGQAIHYLFQKSLKIAKEVRTDFPIQRGPSFEDMLLQLIIKESQGNKILFLGASAINCKLLPLFQKHFDVWLCNRTPIDLPAQILAWQERESWHQFDVVIVATKASGYLISEKPSKSTLLIDLSVPRNIDPNLASYNIDQLHAMMRPTTSCTQQVDGHIHTSVHKQIACYLAHLTRVNRAG